MNNNNFSREMTVALRDCRFFAYHGLLPHERVSGNEFEVTLSVTYPAVRVSGTEAPRPTYCRPGSKDSPETDLTVSYADLFDIVKREMKTPQNLLETVVERISDDVLERWPSITSISVSLSKLTPPIPGFTGRATVTMHTERAGRQ